jgi:hypothetical protein
MDKRSRIFVAMNRLVGTGLLRIKDAEFCLNLEAVSPDYFPDGTVNARVQNARLILLPTKLIGILGVLASFL